jgi:hypothetical protein
VDYNADHLTFQEAVSTDLQDQGYALVFSDLDQDPTSGTGSGAYVRVAATAPNVGTSFGDGPGVSVEDTYGKDFGTIRFTITEAGVEAGETDLFVRSLTTASSYFENENNDPESAVFDVPVTAVSNSNNTSLPVELGSFTGKPDGQAAVLTWETLSETNNRGFHVEQKVEQGQEASWESVGVVEGAGTSQSGERYSHRVEELDFGSHTFRLRQVDRDGVDEVLDKRAHVEVRMSEAYNLQGAYPNPFRSRATIEFAVREAQDVTAELYNTLGQRVRVLHEGEVPGNETVALRFGAGALSSGVYFVRLRGENFAATESITLVR